MDHKYGNLPPTPVLKKKSLVDTVARKQKRNTLGGASSPLPLRNDGEANLANDSEPLKQKSCTLVSRKASKGQGHSKASDTPSLPVIRLRPRAESEPAPYSPAWGKKARSWHAPQIAPLPVPLPIGLLLHLTPSHSRPGSSAALTRRNHNEPSPSSVHPSVVPSSGHPMQSTPGRLRSSNSNLQTTLALFQPPTSAQDRSSNNTSDNPSMTAETANNNSTNNNSDSVAVAPALTSASVQQFFDAQKGSFQKLGTGTTDVLRLDVVCVFSFVFFFCFFLLFFLLFFFFCFFLLLFFFFCFFFHILFNMFF
jgi:hypothetical protein